jgi:hypothetical protein
MPGNEYVVWTIEDGMTLFESGILARGYFEAAREFSEQSVLFHMGQIEDIYKRK